MSSKSKESARIAESALKWWREMQPDPSKGKKGDRASLAILRRCDTVSKAMLEPSIQNLVREIKEKVEEIGPSMMLRIAVMGALLASVREDNAPMIVAWHVGTQGQEEMSEVRYKPLRFRRLLEAETADECLRGFRRLVAIADNKVNVKDLAQSVYEWVKEEDAKFWELEDAENQRMRWAYYYWGAGKPPE